MTETRVRVRIPVWRQSSRYEGQFVFVDVQARSVSADEAPLAVVWMQHFENAESRRHPYRGHGGRLWSPAMLEWAPSLAEMDMFASDALSSQRPSRTLDAIVGRLQHPDAVNLMFAKKVGRAVTGAEVASAMAMLPDLDDALLVVDGKVWTASQGPTIEMEIFGPVKKYPRFLVNDGVPGRQNMDRAHMRLSAIPMDVTRRLLEGHYGRVEILGNAPQVVDPSFSFGDDVARRSVELAIWQFMFESRAKPLSGRDARVVTEVLVDARRALEERWPDVELVMTAKFHAEVATHLHGRRMPPVADLVPLLERIVDVAGKYDDISVHHWRFALQRAYVERDREQSLDPLAALDI